MNKESTLVAERETAESMQERSDPKVGALVDAYKGAPPEHRVNLEKVLRTAALILPTQTEYDREMSEGREAAIGIEMRYRHVAHLYARAIDPEYVREGLNNNPDTLRESHAVYRMIRPLNRDQIVAGYREIFGNPTNSSVQERPFVRR